MATFRVQRVKLRSDKDSHFTTEIAQNAKEDENLTFPVHNTRAVCVIRDILILSKEQLAWTVQFYTKDTFSTTDADTDAFAGQHIFANTDGLQVAGAGLYRYFIANLEIPYEDNDNTREVHVRLVNRSAGAKTAGTNGEMTIELGLDVV